MVNAVLLKPLPVPEPNRVVMIWGTLLKSGFDQLPVSAADYLDWKQQARSFDHMSAAFAIPEYGLNISGIGDPERAPAALASREFLPALGIKPDRGPQFSAGGRPPRRPACGADQQRAMATPISFGSGCRGAHADSGWHRANGGRRGPARARRDDPCGLVASDRD